MLGISQPDRSHDRSHYLAEVGCSKTPIRTGQRRSIVMGMERFSRLIAVTLLSLLIAPGPTDADPGAPRPRRFEPIPSTSPMQRETPVQVLVSKQVREPGRVTYHYRIVNGNPYPIARVTLGYDEDYGVSELLFPPLGSDFEEASASGAQSPPGWTFHLVPTEDDSLFAIEWEAEPLSNALRGGTALDGFSVTLDTEDEAYERGHWSINTTSGDDYYPHTWFILPEAKTKLHPSSIQAQTGITVRPWAGGDSIRVEVGAGSGGRATIQMYDSAGRRVRLLLSGSMAPGTHDLAWNGRNDSGAEVPEGEYFVRIWMSQGLRQARVKLARSDDGREQKHR